MARRAHPGARGVWPKANYMYQDWLEKKPDDWYTTKKKIFENSSTEVTNGGWTTRLTPQALTAPPQIKKERGRVHNQATAYNANMCLCKTEHNKNHTVTRRAQGVWPEANYKICIKIELKTTTTSTIPPSQRSYSKDKYIKNTFVKSHFIAVNLISTIQKIILRRPPSSTPHASASGILAEKIEK